MKEKLSKEYAQNLSGRLYGLLCEFEKDREWEKFLDSILIELQGFDEDEKTIKKFDTVKANLKRLEEEKLQAAASIK